MIFLAGKIIFFLTVFGGAMSEIIGKFLSKYNLSDTENYMERKE
jgi:hypothetical protein